MTSQVAAGLLALALAAGLWLTLRSWPAATAIACTFRRPAPPGAVTFAPTAEPPTAAPTEAAQATSTAAEPEGDYATQAAGEQATTAARATQSPFATAPPVAVQAGEPSLLVARRGGLSLQVRLPKDEYLDGETGQAEVTLSNAGPEPVFVSGGPALFWTTLLDDQGREPPAFPWQPVSMPGPPPYLQSLAPGQSVTGTAVFHVAGRTATYAFWAETRFSRASPANPEGPDNIWLRLEAGPLPLRVLAPTPGQLLQARLQADRLTWSLRVTNLAGQVPAGPLYGLLESASANSFGGRLLSDSPNGSWSMGWGDLNFGSGPFMVRAWVAAPGYVTAVVTQTVDGPTDAAALFFTGQPPVQRTYATLDTAQASLGIPLYHLSVRQNAALAGAAFDSIQAEASASSDFCSITTRQLYHLPSGAWLELTQLYANPPFEGFGWGPARYDAEAQGLSVAGQPAFLIEQFGWWTFDWVVGYDGFELHVPAGSMSPADLLALAESVRR